MPPTPHRNWVNTFVSTISQGLCFGKKMCLTLTVNMLFCQFVCKTNFVFHLVMIQNLNVFPAYNIFIDIEMLVIFQTVSDEFQHVSRVMHKSNITMMNELCWRVQKFIFDTKILCHGHIGWWTITCEGNHSGINRLQFFKVKVNKFWLLACCQWFDQVITFQRK